MFISAVELDFLTWETMGTDSLLEPDSSGHQRTCSFCSPHVSALELDALKLTVVVKKTTPMIPLYFMMSPNAVFCIVLTERQKLQTVCFTVSRLSDIFQLILKKHLRFHKLPNCE